MSSEGIQGSCQTSARPWLNSPCYCSRVIVRCFFRRYCPLPLSLRIFCSAPAFRVDNSGPMIFTWIAIRPAATTYRSKIIVSYPSPRLTYFTHAHTRNAVFKGPIRCDHSTDDKSRHIVVERWIADEQYCTDNDSPDLIT